MFGYSRDQSYHASSPETGVGFAVLGVVIKAIDDAGAAAGANGLNVGLYAPLAADIRSIASTVKDAVQVAVAQQT